MRPAITHPQDMRPITVARPATTDVAGIKGKYLCITSYRRDGSAVATPVWFVTDGGRALVMTSAHSGKIKRIRRNPVVTVGACSARGRPKMDPVPGHAHILPSAEVERVKHLIGRKYRFDLLFIRPIRAIQRLFRPELRNEVPMIVAITPVSSN